MRTRLLAVLASLCLAFVGLVATPAQAVVGGYQVTDGRFGFMASIQYAGTKGSDGHFCGGSVIATRWILTAAHCIVETGVKPRDVQVVVGRVNLDKDLAKGQTLRVDRIVVHPRYVSEGTYDAALLHVTTRIASPAIKLATPTQNTLERDGSRVKVAGWGANSFLVGGIQPQLKAVDLKTVGDSKCGSNAVASDFNAATEICANASMGDSCQGDSGGPLFGNLADGRRIQIGIVSHGLGCATPLFPGVYGEVNNASIYRFITSTIG